MTIIIILWKDIFKHDDTFSIYVFTTSLNCVMFVKHYILASVEAVWHQLIVLWLKSPEANRGGAMRGRPGSNMGGAEDRLQRLQNFAWTEAISEILKLTITIPHSKPKP